MRKGERPARRAGYDAGWHAVVAQSDQPEVPPEHKEHSAAWSEGFADGASDARWCNEAEVLVTEPNGTAWARVPGRRHAVPNRTEREADR